MTTRTRRILTPTLTLLSLGCAGSAYSATSDLPPVPAETVEVFVDRRPPRPYAAVGRFTVEGESRGIRQQGAMLAAARQTAAAMGANAILAVRLPEGRRRLAYLRGDEPRDARVETSVARPAYDVVAIVWRCDHR